MKLTIRNYKNEFKTKNWEVYMADDDSAHQPGYYEFSLAPYGHNASEYHHAALFICRTHTLLSDKINVCFKVKIAIGTYDKIIHEEDISLNSLRKKADFWQSVDDFITQKAKVK